MTRASMMVLAGVWIAIAVMALAARQPVEAFVAAGIVNVWAAAIVIVGHVHDRRASDVAAEISRWMNR